MTEKAKPFTAAASVDGISPLKDGGMSVRFHTQELGKDDKVNLMGYYQSFGYLMFAPQELTEEDIPDEPLEIYEDKTPSQRLRGVIYRLWEKNGSPGDSETYYRQKMEQITNQLKAKL